MIETITYTIFFVFLKNDLFEKLLNNVISYLKLICYKLKEKFWYSQT